ncbi:MAG: hypothetical protein Kow0019_05340 [Methanobacteriaceae archaeon]
MFLIKYLLIYLQFGRKSSKSSDLEFLGKNEIKEIFKKIINQIKAVKIKNNLDKTEKNVQKIIEMLFLLAIIEYKMEDRDMDIWRNCR